MLVPKKTIFTVKKFRLLLILFTMLITIASPDIVSSNKHPRYLSSIQYGEIGTFPPWDIFGLGSVKTF